MLDERRHVMVEEILLTAFAIGSVAAQALGYVRKQSELETSRAARRRGEKQLHNKLQARGGRTEGHRIGRQAAQERREKELHGQMSE